MTTPANKSAWAFATLAALTLLASLVLGAFVVSTHLAEAERNFDQQANAIHAAIGRRIASTEAVVTALVGLHHASDDLRTHEFAALAEELLKAYPFIRSIGEVAAVEDAARPAFETAARDEGFPQFAIRSLTEGGSLEVAGRQSFYLPLRTIQPLDPLSAQLLGYDIRSHPVLSEVARQAVYSGIVETSPVFEFAQGEMGFVAVKAIYLGYRTPQTPSERRAQLRGLVILYQSTEALLQDIVGESSNLSVAFGDRTREAHLFRLRAGGTEGTGVMGEFVFHQPLILRDRTFGLELIKRPGLEVISFSMVGLVMALPLIAGAAFAMALRNRLRAQREIRRSAQQIKLNEERLRDYAEVSADWFWSTDEALCFDYFSKPVTDITGLDPGQPLSDLGAGREAHALSGEAGDQRSQIATHESFRDLIHSYRTEADEIRWWSLSGKPVFDEVGAFLGYRGTGRDITAEITGAEQLLASKEAAELANRSKSQFLASISHELRTPLNAIIGFSELMEREILGPLGRKEYQDYVGDIGDSGRHLLDLINDILDISKIESGAASVVDDIIDLRQLVTSSTAMVKGRARDSGVELTVQFVETLPPLRADPRKLKQVLVNLLSNSVKFTPRGGQVTVSVERAPTSDLQICVADTGIGMSAEDIPKALTPFQQVDSDLNRKFEGTGLGLPLAKSLVELHDGRLEIESVVGHGTAVTLLLPAERFCEEAGRGGAEETQSPAPALRAV